MAHVVAPSAQPQWVLRIHIASVDGPWVDGEQLSLRIYVKEATRPSAETARGTDEESVAEEIVWQVGRPSRAMQVRTLCRGHSRSRWNEALTIPVSRIPRTLLPHTTGTAHKATGGSGSGTRVVVAAVFAWLRAVNDGRL